MAGAALPGVQRRLDGAGASAEARAHVRGRGAGARAAGSKPSASRSVAASRACPSAGRAIGARPALTKHLGRANETFTNAVRARSLQWRRGFAAVRQPMATPAPGAAVQILDLPSGQLLTLSAARARQV